MPDTGREIAPREALLEAITSFDIGKVRAMFSDPALEALSIAIGQDATKDEVRRALVTQDGKTTSLLMTACSIGNIEAAEVLIQEGSPIDAVAPSGNTAVFYAARSGYYNILKLLTSKGADVNAKNASGDTTLMFCASGASQPTENATEGVDFVKCISHLLDLGVSVESANKNGLNALHCAASNFLVLNAIIAWFSSNQSLSASLKASINQRTIIGDTPLHFAAAEGAFKCCELLLSHGADPLQRSKAGKTALACTKDPSCVSLLKSAESSASETYHKKQQELLDELASESPTKSANPPSNRKSKASKKTNKAPQVSAPVNEPISLPAASPTQISATSPSKPSKPSPIQNSTDKTTATVTVKSQEKAQQPAPFSWASVVSSASATAPLPQRPAFVLEKSTQTTQTADQMAADESKITKSKTAHPIELLQEASGPSQYALDQQLDSLHPMANVLGINVGQMLGLGISELSMEQLDALEAMHQSLIKSINAAKLEVIRKQERAFFEEELDRRLETIKRVQSGKY